MSVLSEFFTDWKKVSKAQTDQISALGQKLDEFKGVADQKSNEVEALTSRLSEASANLETANATIEELKGKLAGLNEDHAAEIETVASRKAAEIVSQTGSEPVPVLVASDPSQSEPKNELFGVERAAAAFKARRKQG